MAIQDYLQRRNEHDCVTQVYRNQKITSSTETIVVSDFLDCLLYTSDAADE